MKRYSAIISKILMLAIITILLMPMHIFANDLDAPINEFRESGEYGDLKHPGDTIKPVEVHAFKDVEVSGGDIDASDCNQALFIQNFGYDVTVNTGNITNSDYVAVAVISRGGKTEITVNGSLKGGRPVPETIYENAVDIQGNRGIVDTTIKGDIDGGSLNGLKAYGLNKGGKTITNIEGSVNGYEYGVLALGRNSGLTTIDIGKDVTADKVGIYGYGLNGGSVEVRVEGTITGNDLGVEVNKDDSSTVNVTAWAITPVTIGGERVVAAKLVDDEYVQDEDFEKNNINYIIRVDDSASGAALSASQGIAHEGDKVLLRVDLEPGYVINGVYDNNGIYQQYALSQDENGNYYVIVPKGGGVFLSVSVGKKYLPPQPVNEDNSSSSEEAPQTPVVTVSTPQVIFDAAPGATVDITIPGGTSLDKSFVEALEARKDITLVVNYMYNGRMFRVIIPPGFDLTPFKNAAGGIDFDALTIHLGGVQI